MWWMWIISEWNHEIQSVYHAHDFSFNWVTISEEGAWYIAHHSKLKNQFEAILLIFVTLTRFCICAAQHLRLTTVSYLELMRKKNWFSKYLRLRRTSKYSSEFWYQLRWELFSLNINWTIRYGHHLEFKPNMNVRIKMVKKAHLYMQIWSWLFCMEQCNLK